MLQTVCGNLISCSAPFLTFQPWPFIHSPHRIIHSIIPIHSLPPFSTFTVSPAPPPSFYAPLSFLISDSFSSPLLSHSYTSVRPSICLPLLPPSYLSLFSQSVSRSISRPQEIVSFAIQRVGGVYSLSQTKRSLCESSKNTKKKRKADKIRNLLSSASRIQTHMHTLYLRCTRAKHFPNIQQRHKILFSF